MFAQMRASPRTNQAEVCGIQFAMLILGFKERKN